MIQYIILIPKQRLETLRCLSEQHICLELMEFVGIDGKTVTHHLNVLEEADIVSSCMKG